MKKSIFISILSLLIATGSTILAQNYSDEYLGLPGDNLNLYAVMNLFQESETLEGFERDLNDPDSKINNLDLNSDNYVDYIMVSDYQEGNVHNIVLRVALDQKSNQDVAVFIVEQLKDESVQIQLIGDETLYGKDYIIEPNYAETRNPGYTGPKVQSNQVNVVRTNYYEVAAWPLMRFIYRPNYHVWHSSWHWGNYPSYWASWRPYYWHYYNGYHSSWYPHYHSWYRHANNYRWHGYHNHYYKHVRVYSPTVVININKGHYRSTYSRPDQSRAGKALYLSVRSGSDTRSRNSTVYKSLNRPSSSSHMGRKSETSTHHTGTERQRVTGVKNSPGTTRTAPQTTVTERRTSSGANNNRYTRPVSVRKTTTVTKSGTSVAPVRTSRTSPSYKSTSNKNTSPSQIKRSVRVQSTAQRSTNIRNSEAPSSVQRPSSVRSRSTQSTLQKSNHSASPTRSTQRSIQSRTSSTLKSTSAPARRETVRTTQSISKSPASRSSSSRVNTSSVSHSRSSSPKATVQRSAPSKSSARSARSVSSSSQSKTVSKTKSASQTSNTSGNTKITRSRRE